MHLQHADDPAKKPQDFIEAAPTEYWLCSPVYMINVSEMSVKHGSRTKIQTEDIWSCWDKVRQHENFTLEGAKQEVGGAVRRSQWGMGPVRAGAAAQMVLLLSPVSMETEPLSPAPIKQTQQTAELSSVQLVPNLTV